MCKTEAGYSTPVATSRLLRCGSGSDAMLGCVLLHNSYCHSQQEFLAPLQRLLVEGGSYNSLVLPFMACLFGLSKFSSTLHGEYLPINLEICRPWPFRCMAKSVMVRCRWSPNLHQRQVPGRHSLASKLRFNCQILFWLWGNGPTFWRYAGKHQNSC